MAKLLSRALSIVCATSAVACGTSPSNGGALFSPSSGGETGAFGGVGASTAVGSGGQATLPASGGTSATASGGTPAGANGGQGMGLFSTTPNANEPTCGTHEITVLFLLDRSGSMNCNLPPITASADCENMSPPAKVDTTQPSKWEVISSTLSSALDQLVPMDPTIHVRAGIGYFSIDGVCGANSMPAVPVAEATPDQLDQIRTSVSSQTPAGGTPIVGATILDYKYLYQTLQVTDSAHVILITDGSDSCADYYAANPAIGPGDHVEDLIQHQAPTALGVGIKTWVIGAPGSEPARWMLSNLAVGGGTRRSDDCTPGTSADPTVGDCHYDMTNGDFQAALGMALGHIMSVVTCQTPS